jgi:hypothetical protein
MHDMRSVLSGIVWPSLRSHQYILSEKANLWRGKHSAGVSALWDEMLVTDLTGKVTELPVPAYFWHGVYDDTVNYHVAKRYCDVLKAPVKGFYTFCQSAHSPMLEELEKARRIITTMC